MRTEEIHVDGAAGDNGEMRGKYEIEGRGGVGRTTGKLGMLV